MAIAYCLLGLTDYLPPKEIYPKAKAFALKAIEIDPATADAHVVLATVKMFYDWDWEGAESAFRRAIESESQQRTCEGAIRISSSMSLGE